MPAKATGLTEDSFYAVLGLPEPIGSRQVTPGQVKVAFRRALLKHHPDKAAQLLNQPNGEIALSRGIATSKYTVDDICLARDTLIDPARRRDYDNALRLKNTQTSPNRTVSSLHPTELETLDLDDMLYDERTASWAKVCRCGNTRAYEVSEEDLEIASSDGESEVLVGCGGCSLFVRIVFEAVDAD